MINNTSCPAKLCQLTLGSRRVARMWSLCSSNITYQHHQIKYLHVFTPNISIRNHRHKHPHYVLMWRRIQLSCQQHFCLRSSQSADRPTYMPGDKGTIFQASALPVWWHHRGRQGGRDSFLPAFLPAKLLALPSFLFSRHQPRPTTEMTRSPWWGGGGGGGGVLWLGGFWQVR